VPRGVGLGATRGWVRWGRPHRPRGRRPRKGAPSCHLGKSRMKRIMRRSRNIAAPIMISVTPPGGGPTYPRRFKPPGRRRVRPSWTRPERARRTTSRQRWAAPHRVAGRLWRAMSQSVSIVDVDPYRVPCAARQRAVCRARHAPTRPRRHALPSVLAHDTRLYMKRSRL
jgi:hypothetical protein